MNIYLHNKVAIPNVLKNLRKIVQKMLLGLVGKVKLLLAFNTRIFRFVECILADTGGCEGWVITMKLKTDTDTALKVSKSTGGNIAD